MQKGITVNRIILSLITLLIFLSCNSKPHQIDSPTKEILSKTMKKTGEYISGNFLRYYGPKSLPEEQQNELNSAFKIFLNLYSSVEAEYQNSVEVKQFLVLYLNSHHSYNPKNSKAEFWGDNPVEVAATLISPTNIDLNTINNSDYLKEIATQISISQEQLYNGLYYLLTHNPEDIVAK
jgi:hypothetical protein